MVFPTVGGHILYMVVGLLKETKMTKVKVFFSQKSHIDFTYETISSRLDGITSCIYHPFDETKFHLKMLFNVNISFNINLAQCVSIPREIDVQITNNMYLLIYLSCSTKFCIKFQNFAIFIHVVF